MADRVRIFLLLGLGALAIGLGIWAMIGSGDSEQLEKGSRIDSAEEVGAPPGLEPRRRAMPDLPPTAGEVEIAPEAAEAAALGSKPETEADATGLEVRLQVRVLDREGQPWPENSGRLTLSLERNGQEPLRRQIDLVDGFAKVVVGEDVEFISVDGAKIGAEKRDAQAEDLAHLGRRDFADGHGEIELTLLPRVLVRVLDALDRRELHAVAVVRTEGEDWGGMRPFDLSGVRRVAQGDSPLVVGVTEHGTSKPYWVIAPGHAAGLLYFDAESEGERILQLEAGGALHLKIEGDIAGLSRELRPWLRLRRVAKAETAGSSSRFNAAEAFCEELLGQSREAQIDYLPVGQIEVSLEVGDSWAPSATLAKGRVEIAAGTSANLTLTVENSALILQPAKASGYVQVPADGLEGRHLSIYVRPADPKDKKLTPRAYITAFPLEDDATQCRFVDLELFPGRYVAVIEGEEFPFDLPAGGRDDLRFALPVREVVELVLRNAGEEKALIAANVSWWSAAGNGEAFWNAERRAYLCTPPTGELQISAWTAEGSIDTQVLRAPGQTRLEVVLPKPQHFKLVLKAKGLIIPHDFGLDLDIRDKDDQQVFIRSMSSDGDQVIRKLDEPGSYSVRLRSAPAGYQAGPAVRFEVKPGQTKEVVIELEPVR